MHHYTLLITIDAMYNIGALSKASIMNFTGYRTVTYRQADFVTLITNCGTDLSVGEGHISISMFISLDRKRASWILYLKINVRAYLI